MQLPACFSIGHACLVILLSITVHARPPLQAEPWAKKPNTRGTRALAYLNVRGRVTSQIDEEFSFNVQDLKMNHQGEVNTLNLNVRYLYVHGIRDDDYPDFRLLVVDIEKFLEGYPNKKDYWEVVNKKMANLLLRKYRALERISIELRVSPSKLEPYYRTSTVTLSRAGRRRL